MRSAPSPVARVVVRAIGVTSALALAPRLLLDLSGIAPAGSGPGWVRLRCTSETLGRRQCLERQGAIVALPERFGLEPLVLEDTSCVARGDPACEYLLHHRSPPRWALVVAAAGMGLALGWGARLAPAFILLLGALTAAASYVVEHWRAARGARGARIVSSRAFRRLVVGAAEPVHRAEPVDRGPVLEQEGDVWRV